jgi:Glycosyl hydrolases family 6
MTTVLGAMQIHSQLGHLKQLHGGRVQCFLQSNAACVPTAHMFAEENSCTRCRWLGWDSNMQAAVALYAKLIRGAEGAGPGLVRGLATDIANYTPRECSADDKFIPSSTISTSSQPMSACPAVHSGASNTPPL